MEQKEQGNKKNNDATMFFASLGVAVCVFVVGVVVGQEIGSRTEVDSIEDPKTTQLWNSGYVEGYNEALSSVPDQTYKYYEPTVSEAEVVNQIVEALGTADKVDLEIHGDKDSGRTTLSLTIEFSSDMVK